jgi:hypothetical protein
MPTRTIPRRAAASTRGAGRFSRPAAHQRPAPRGRGGRKKQQSSGLGGMLGSAMSALPIGGSSKKRGRKGGSSKTGPAVGLVMAGAGALLGRRQMKRRRSADATDLTTPQ